jgi:hypothetical protein
LGQDGQFAIAVNEVRRQVQVQQTPKRFAGHGAGNDIAPYYNLVNVRLTNILKDSLQGWKVPMNIVEGGNSHLDLPDQEDILIRYDYSDTLLN